MSQDGEIAAVEGNEEDRFSDLPGNIIDHIVELLPGQDAARTSILSKKWRYVWPKLPYLVLDHNFCSRFIGKSQSFFKQTVDEILSRHLGDIVKFVLFVPDERWPSYDDVLSYEDVDRWIRHVTRNGIKELTLYMPPKDEDEILYEVPSYVFNLTMLTCLELCYCAFKPPNSTLDFPKLETLHLEGVNIVPKTQFCVLNVPVLVNLNLMQCDGTQYLHIVSPLLEVLCVYEVHYLVLNYFMNCKKLRELHLSLFKMIGTSNHDEMSTVEKLLYSLAPTLEKLDFTASFLELLNAGTIPKQPLSMLNCLWYISSIIDFRKLSQTSALLRLITSVPNLRKLEIEVDGTDDDADAVLEYLNTQACVGQSLNKLKHVVVRCFRGSKIELLFIELLFAHTPSLARMSIEDLRSGSSEDRIIPATLMSFPRASPNAEVNILPI